MEHLQIFSLSILSPSCFIFCPLTKTRIYFWNPWNILGMKRKLASFGKQFEYSRIHHSDVNKMPVHTTVHTDKATRSFCETHYYWIYFSVNSTEVSKWFTFFNLKKNCGVLCCFNSWVNRQKFQIFLKPIT